MSMIAAAKRPAQVIAIALAIAMAGSSAASAETLAELAQRTHYHGIAFNRASTAELLLATHHGLLAVHKDATVIRISPVQDFMGFSPDPASPLSYYASGHPSTGGNSGFLHSSDGGATWNRLSEGVDGPVDFHQMDVSPADPRTIYGGYGKIQVSRDGGSTWAVAGDPPPQLIAIAASSLNADRIYAASKAGLYVSDDAATTWKLAAFEGEIVSLVKSAPDNVLYVFVLGRGLLKLSEKNPGQWTTLSNSFGDAIPLHFAIDEKDSSHLALTTQNNEVLESRDAGATWRLFGSAAE